METKKTCSCNDKTAYTVMACSGAADLGHISDLVARKLHQKDIRTLKCLAFVGAGIQSMIDSVKDSDILIIDGCPLDCGRLVMEKNNLTDFHHLRLTDLGYEKGKTPANEENVKAIYEKAEVIL